MVDVIDGGAIYTSRENMNVDDVALATPEGVEPPTLRSEV
jgi:hypothetical protein